MTEDLLSRAAPFLNQCAPCDYGLPSQCTCEKAGFRPVMLELVREVERLRAVAWQLHGAMVDQHEEVGHQINDWCEPCSTAAKHADPDLACGDYKRRQKAYVDALGLVIGEKP
jgi:hypothetical protein